MLNEITKGTAVLFFEIVGGEAETQCVVELAYPMQIPQESIVSTGNSPTPGDESIVVEMGATNRGCLYMVVFEAKKTTHPAQ